MNYILYDRHIVSAFMHNPQNVCEFIWHVFTHNNYDGMIFKIMMNMNYEWLKNATFNEILKTTVHNYGYQRSLLDYEPFRGFYSNYVKGKFKKQPLPKYEKITCKLPNYNKKTLISFLNKEQTEQFIKFLFISRTPRYPKLKKFFKGIMNNIASENNENELSQSSAIEMILKILCNIDNEFIEISHDEYTYCFKPSFGERPVSNPFNTLHDIFCEYNPYVDFAIYYTNRKERLCFFMEQIYNICGTQKQRLEPIYYVFSDEYIVKNIANFL